MKKENLSWIETAKLRKDIQRIRQETLGNPDEVSWVVEELISGASLFQEDSGLEQVAISKLKPHKDGTSIIDSLDLHEEFDVISSKHEEWDAYSIMKIEKKK